MKEEIVKVESNSAVDIYKAEIDVQIATAKAYPRTVKQVIKEVGELATLDKETAASCFYCKPIDNKGGTVEGASVRFAEIVAGLWGNLRVKTYIKEETQTNIVAVCEIHDLQKNTAQSSEVIISIIGKYGRFSQNVIETNKMAAQAKAFRNAVLKIIPKGLFDSTLAVIKEASVDNKALVDENALRDSINKGVLYFVKLGVTEPEILNSLGVRSKADLTKENLITLGGFKTALNEKTETIDSIFRIKKENNDFEDIEDLPKETTKPKK